MRLEFEPNVTAIPLVENELFEDVGFRASSDFNTLLKKGISAAQNGERERARALLTEASECDPRSEDAWMWLASISDYPEELLAFLNNVLEINPQNARAVEWLASTNSLLAATFVQRAVAANEEGSRERAEQFLDQALAHHKDCEMAWFWKASLSPSDDEKLAFLERVLEINPENHDAHNAVAAINHSRSQAALDEAKAAAVSGNRQKAVDILDQFLQVVPDSVEAWTLKSHLSPGVDEKIAALERALEIDPENAAARSGLDFLTLTFGTSQQQPGHHEEQDSPAESSEEYENVEQEHPGYDDHELDEFLLQPWAKKHEFEAAPIEFEAAPEGTFEEPVNADAETVEYLVPLVQNAADENSFAVEYNDYADSVADVYHVEAEPSAETVVETPCFDEKPEDLAGFACPFCMSLNESHAFECTSCHATLTVLDIESLLSNPRVDREVVQQAVTEMEAEWNLREFDEKELTALGIGHCNLNNLETGFKFLREASRSNADNVSLAGQVNTMAIRLEEMRRQTETYDLMPKGKTILVVDDSPTVRKLIAGKLEKSGHNVVCAVDGIDALARLEESMPDLVLLDIAMPRMDGYEVCKQIRSKPETKDLPVVMISGKDGFFDKVRGRMAGTTGYVTKPFGPETLMKALEVYLLPDNAEVN